jgi:hypothetical protein
MLLIMSIIICNNVHVLLAQGPGKALILNGNNQYVDLGFVKGLNSSTVSIEAWIKKQEFSRIESIVSNGSLSLKIGADDKPYFELVDGSETITEVGISTENNIYAMTVYKGKLYAGLSKFGRGPNTGRVYCYDGGTRWFDAGRLGETDWVYNLTVYNGKLYAGTGYPGKVYRFDGDSIWTDIGQLGTSEHVRVLVVFNGKLYGGGSSGMVYRYDGDSTWTNIGHLGLDEMVHSLTVYDGELYGGGYYTRTVYRYDGDSTWAAVGLLNSNGRYVLSFAVYDGALYAATGGGGISQVYRYEGGTNWTEVGMLGSWTASLVVYNGKLYAGTSNKGATIFRYEGRDEWRTVGQIGQVDQIWSMVIYDGKMHVGAGNPFSYQGKIYSVGSGLAVYSTTPLNGRYSHLAAVYDGGNARIYLNGEETGHRSGAIRSNSNTMHLLIGGSYGSSQSANGGSGEEYFNGIIDEVRIWGDALTESVIREWMCKKLTLSHPNWIDLRSYIRFDDSIDHYLTDHSGNGTTGTMVHLDSDVSLIRSGAALGDESIYTYDQTAYSEMSISLYHDDGESFTVTCEGDTCNGIHLYSIDEEVVQPDGFEADTFRFLNPLRLWGVYIVGADKPTYSIVYKYDKHPDIFDEYGLDIAYCHDFAEGTWMKGNAVLDVHTKTLQLDVQTDCGLFALVSITGFTSLAEEFVSPTPREYAIYQNYPNPFNPSTVIRYQLPVSGHVTLVVYDILGKEATTLVNEYKPAGKYDTVFDASHLPSGVYIYRLQAGSFVESKKLLLLK